MTSSFLAGDMVGGLVRGIQQLGEAAHHPQTLHTRHISTSDAGPPGSFARTTRRKAPAGSPGSTAVCAQQRTERAPAAPSVDDGFLAAQGAQPRCRALHDRPAVARRRGRRPASQVSSRSMNGASCSGTGTGSAARSPAARTPWSPSALASAEISSAAWQYFSTYGSSTVVLPALPEGQGDGRAGSRWARRRPRPRAARPRPSPRRSAGPPSPPAACSAPVTVLSRSASASIAASSRRPSRARLQHERPAQLGVDLARPGPVRRPASRPAGRRPSLSSAAFGKALARASCRSEPGSAPPSISSCTPVLPAQQHLGAVGPAGCSADAALAAWPSTVRTATGSDSTATVRQHQLDVVRGGQLAVAAHVPGRRPARPPGPARSPGRQPIDHRRAATRVEPHLGVRQVVVVDQRAASGRVRPTSSGDLGSADRRRRSRSGRVRTSLPSPLAS